MLFNGIRTTFHSIIKVKEEAFSLIQNFTYLAFLCGISMLLVVGGVLLTNVPLPLQIIMIFIGLVGGVFCFITLIRVLIKHNVGDTNRESAKHKG